MQSDDPVEWRSSPIYYCALAHKQSFYYHNHLPTCPKKHVRKKPIFMAFIAKQKYSLCCGNAFIFSIGSRGLSPVPFSSIFYHWDIGISIPTTTTTNPGAAKTKELCQQGRQMPPYSMLDYGSGWSVYAGDDGGEGMMEDRVEANRFAAEHSCLNNNIDTNKNQGLFFVATMMLVQLIVVIGRLFVCQHTVENRGQSPLN